MDGDVVFTGQGDKLGAWIGKARKASVGDQTDIIFGKREEGVYVLGVFIEKVDGKGDVAKELFLKLPTSFFAFCNEGIERRRIKAPGGVFVEEIREEMEGFQE